jgi:hypothetical protein
MLVLCTYLAPSNIIAFYDFPKRVEQGIYGFLLLCTKIPDITYNVLSFLVSRNRRKQELCSLSWSAVYALKDGEKSSTAERSAGRSNQRIREAVCEFKNVLAMSPMFLFVRLEYINPLSILLLSSFFTHFTVLKVPKSRCAGCMFVVLLRIETAVARILWSSRPKYRVYSAMFVDSEKHSLGCYGGFSLILREDTRTRFLYVGCVNQNMSFPKLMCEFAEKLR